MRIFGDLMLWPPPGMKLGFLRWWHNSLLTMLQLNFVSYQLAINQKNDNDVIISWLTSSSIFFDIVAFLLSSLVTGTCFTSILCIPDIEIKNTTVWDLPIIWRLGWVGETKFGMNVSNEKLLNTAKCQVYSFYHFWVIKGKPTGEGGKNTTLHPTLLLPTN